MTSTAWNARNLNQFDQQKDPRFSTAAPSTGHLTKTPSRTGRSSSIFSFGSKRTSSTQITPFTPNLPTIPSSQQQSPEQNAASNNLSDSQPPPRPSLINDPPTMNPALVIQREIKSVVDLALAHAHKIYYSGPLIRRIERLADGNKPALDEGWVDVWAQLGGTTLSVWDMKAIEEASKRGEEVPPSYINITDSFVQVLGALTSPATPTSPSKRYTNVITLNTAGSNLIFFACPSSAALVAWATSIRLAGWEKSRLEEIYTGHLLRMTLSDNGTWRDPPRTLPKNRLEGFVKARISGHTDWKTFWMSLSLSTEYSSEDHAYRSNSPVMSTRSKHRVSNLFSRNHQNEIQTAGSVVPVISFYASPKPKDRKKPLLTMRNVTQAYAVYPERPEVIQKSTLIKIEGHLGTEDVAGPMKGRECWIMIMPETQQAFPVLELVKWLIAIHDIYNLYGRPNAYIWDPRQPISMWFGYPVGPQREHLFVSREEAERLDPRDDRTSSIRAQLNQILIQRMYSSNLPPNQSKPVETDRSQSQPPQQQGVGQAPVADSPQTQIQLQQRQPSETGSIFAKQSVSGSPQSPRQTAKETPLLSQNTLESTSLRSSDIQSANSVSLLPPTTISPKTSLSQPPPGRDNSTQGQFSDTEPAPHSASPDQFMSHTVEEKRHVTSTPREGAAASSNPSSVTPRPPGATLPLHLHSHKTSPVASPPRSPPLPPMPKQVLIPPEIKQPVPLNADLANSSSPVATNMNDLVNEPAALFVLQEPGSQHDARKAKETTDTWIRNDWDSEEEAVNVEGPDRNFANSPSRRLSPQFAPPSAYKSNNGENSARGDGGHNTRVRTSVGRKPSGARARPGSGLVRPPEFDTQPSATSLDQMDERSELPYDDTVSTLAAMNFFDSQGFDLPSLSASLYPKKNSESISQPIPSQESSTTVSSNETPQFRSSFALSKQAAERQAKVQAQQEARHQPGKRKTNGGIKPTKKASGAWAESSEEEEEEEDDDDDDDDDGSDGDKPSKPTPSVRNKQSVPDARPSVYPSAQPNASKEGIPHSRFLPQPPNNGGLDPNRVVGEDRRRASPGDELRPHPANAHTFARQSVWSSVLDPTPPSKSSANNQNTFIQVDDSETMTKAFQPQGLLSAGMQDREDRSARRQEEVARETGASLINVPNKPPPPQTGLLGAITAHERERKREGGVGAALTERERERRLAEERQRKLDDLQRQQLDQMSQPGMGNPYELYGQQGFPGFMPAFDPRMSMNPMMLNPFMGFTPMPYGNPQQNMAAMMAAQQAYQQAMLSFSQAGGSQAGDTPNPNAGMTTPLVPQMTGMSGIQPSMMGVDPRMSMMFNPWMMNPATMGMGMNMSGMPNMNMNPQGGLDPKSAASAINRPDSAATNPGRAASLGTPGTPSSRQNSPAPPRSSSNSPLPPSQI